MTRWAVLIDKDKRYIAGLKGKGVAWTSDRDEADRLAKMIGGRVVDADEWIKNPTFKP